MEADGNNAQWQRLAPRLHALPKEDPFRVADGFFEQFPHRVQALAVQRAKAPGRPGTRPWAWALPVLALLAAAVWLWRPGGGPRAAAVPELSPQEFISLLPEFRPEAAEADAYSNHAAWDSVAVELSDDEALAYFDHEQPSMYDVLQCLPNE